MTVVTSVFLTDGYTDKPLTARDQLEHEIRRLKCAAWADPADKELRQEIERLEAELRELDGGGERMTAAAVSLVEYVAAVREDAERAFPRICPHRVLAIDVLLLESHGAAVAGDAAEVARLARVVEAELAALGARSRGSASP